MAMTFPSTPTTGQTYSVSGGPTYTWDGTVWKILTPGSQFSEQQFTATAGQTVFTVSGGYVIGGIDVYRNGVKLIVGVDYLATDLSTVTLTNAASAGDTVEVVSLAQILYSDALKKTGDTMTGNLSFAQNSTISAASTKTLTLNGGGGSNGLVLDASNNVGIGTSSPVAKLEVAGEIRIYPSSGTGNLRFGSGGVEKGKLLVDSSGNMGFETAGAQRMTLDSSGNLGLGVTPTDKMSILTAQGINTFVNSMMTYGANSGWPAGFANIYDANYVDQFVLINARMTGGTRSSPTFTTSAIGGGIGLKVSGSVGGLAFLTIPTGSGQVGTQAMTLDASGVLTVGTGANTATQRAAFLGGYTVFENSAGTNNPSITFNNDTDTGFWNPGANTIAFGTGGSERARIDSSGNVGIGYYTDAGNTLRYLDVQNANTGGSAGAITRLITSNVAGSGTVSADIIKYKFGAFILNNNETNVAAYTSFGVGGSERMRIDSSGNLLVGNTVNDSSRLSVEATTVGYAIRFRRNTTTYGTSAIVGSIACDGSSTVYNTSSDQRLKTNITSSGSAAQSILDFPVDQFDWISDGSHVDFGAVAQKAINVIPEMVSVPEDPEEMWGIDWSKAVPRLIRAYQELHTEIESLKARIN